MTAKIRFYRDSSQQPRVQADAESFVLADYLESDLQDSATATEVGQMLLKERSGEDMEISGNSYTLILQGDEVCLENLFDDTAPLYKMSVATFAPLITGWIEFLTNENLLSLVPAF